MAQIQPFRAIRYRAQHVPELSEALCPPFDLLGGHDRYRYYLRHPYNAIRLELGQDDPGDSPSENRNTRAGATFADWLATGILRRDELVGFYLYETTFRDRRRSGFFGLVRLDEQEVVSAERLEPRRVAERLELLKGAAANFSPILGLFRDDDQLVTEILYEAMEEAPFVDLVDEGGERHRMWRLLDKFSIARIQEVLAASPLVLIDGHHRHAAAVQYAQLLNAHGADAQAGAHNYCLALCVDQEDPGLVVEPMHRLVRVDPLPEGWLDRLAERFELERHPLREDLPRPEQLETLLADFMAGGTGRLAMMSAQAQELIWLRPRTESALLDAVRLEREILVGVLGLGEAELVDSQTVAYAHDPREALVGLGSGRFDLAFFLAPPSLEAVCEVARSGTSLPPRTVHPYPPVPAGLLFNSLEGTL